MPSIAWGGAKSMFDDAITHKLRDPAYLDLHFMAVASIRKVGALRWYDSNFLRRFEVAKHYLALVAPGSLDAFVGGFAPLLPRPDFAVTLLSDLFDAQTHAKIVEISRSVPREADHKQQRNELDQFGRHVIWDHPFFLELQSDLVPRVSAIAGCELVPKYNFLSLYGGAGKCDPHMDEPMSMFTLDYCIEQSEEWPIFFSRVVEWPSIDESRDIDLEALKADPHLSFEPYCLKPNEALVFNGSSQWHYRNAIAPGGYCSLLFFHYFPKGCENLVEPPQWSAHFDIPELGPLCDIFRQRGDLGLA